MLSAIQKLEKDIIIITAMAEEMAAYLDSDVLFWHMSGSGMPTLTLGGYLMRQHRLLILRGLFGMDKQNAIDAAVRQFNEILVERIVRFEQKGHRELDARIRQWSAYLNELDRGVASKTSNYGTAVESRAMIEAISAPLQLAPYKLNPRIPSQITLLDTQLKRFWESGDFVWYEEWQPAYPQDEYWWLYGTPSKK